jgi:hypothetical protein
VLRRIFGGQEGRGNRGVEKITKLEALCSVLLTKYHWGNQVKNTKMDKSVALMGRGGVHTGR